MANHLRIGARGSKLSLCQTRWVAAQLAAHYPDCEITIEAIRTLGDAVQDKSLASMGGQGVFTRELDAALLEGRIDLAVHSLKDIPTQAPEGVLLAAIPPREDPRDAFLGAHGQPLAALPPGATVATGSVRRQALLREARPDIKAVAVRGNIDTRLKKLHEGEAFSGMILACAGLRRLGLDQHITQALDPMQWIPAPGQGALAITIRSEETALRAQLQVVHCSESAAQVTAERSLLRAVEGGCHAPVGAWAKTQKGVLHLNAMLAAPDASAKVSGAIEGPIESAEALGEALAKTLLKQGGEAIMAALRSP